ncbi:hypothetical protein [Winogradskyella ouciana]|uniref:SGNH/GDSL hydrolase family protein n=1 Tax=Winogradskyella ouciana TaxID=2608631 RepID=A0A7K1GB56_9FLAO|nr:hypothetical protein [Winogradskyella ouciana]MTE26536.1 hypothetical protein [Winogradskyella ouciana]
MRLGIKIICGILAVLAFGWLMNYVVKTIALKDFKVLPKKEILVFGDSHAECSFKEEGTAIQNFGVRSETPNLTLLKYKQLTDEKRNKNVIITLSPHNLSSWHRQRFFVNDSSGATLSKYWALLDNNYLLDHYSTLPAKTRLLLHLKKITGAPNIEPTFKIKSTFIGGYYRGKDTSLVNISEANKAIKRHYGKNGLNCDKHIPASQLLKEYYKDLVSYIVNHNSRVYILAVPLNINYRNQICDKSYEEYDQFLLELKAEFPEIDIMDYSELELPDHYFLNPDHLNNAGASYFSQLIQSKILHQ